MDRHVKTSVDLRVSALVLVRRAELRLEARARELEEEFSFRAHMILYHSALGSRVIKRRERLTLSIEELSH